MKKKAQKFMIQNDNPYAGVGKVQNEIAT